MKLTVKRTGKKPRNKSLKELARDTKRMVFGGSKKKTSKAAKKGK
jgi:hypothetical protein